MKLLNYGSVVELEIRCSSTSSSILFAGVTWLAVKNVIWILIKIALKKYIALVGRCLT